MPEQKSRYGCGACPMFFLEVYWNVQVEEEAGSGGDHAGCGQALYKSRCE
jgi:hypothetical protein